LTNTVIDTAVRRQRRGKAKTSAKKHRIVSFLRQSLNPAS
jgi:hypothetical protein